MTSTHAAGPRGSPGAVVRAIVFVLAVAAGVAGGSWAGLWARGSPGPSAREPARSGSPGAASRIPATTRVASDTVLVWTPNGLPRGFARRVSHLRGVGSSVAVTSGIAWLTETAGDLATSRAPRRYAYPIEVAAAPLDRYAAFLPPAERPLLATLRAGEGMLGEMAARIRGVEGGTSATLTFRPRWPRHRGRVRVPVGGIVPDSSIGANELMVSPRTARRLGVRTRRYILIDPAPGVSSGRVASRVRRLVPPDVPVRIRRAGETPYLRQGDAVLPQVQMKELFGEFAARPEPGGFLAIDPGWVSRHITVARLPLVGTVRCNRAILPQLRGALGEIEAQGLGQLVNPRQFGGCFSPRFTNRIPNAGISHHAWGTAVDVNVAANPYGHPPTQDPRIVAIFARWGFTWGGRFLVPDGMHFDFVRFASG